MPEQIKVQQALFGYLDGHNMLAASTTLAPRVRQFLATITDSSGSDNAKGFEIASFTGLPVPETDFYALFSSWPAPEMPRPGCVWSHVILVQLADLARIPDLSKLQNVCARPSVPVDLNLYDHPLELDVSRMEEHRNGFPDEKRLDYLVRALYEYPEKAVVILDEDSAGWVNPIFRVWSQQWPRLRREFTFSTGSLGDRRHAGIAFDLQVAPINSERLWGRTRAPTLLLNYPAQAPEPFSRTIPEWVDIAVDDLLKGSDQQFRRFLFDFGSDIQKPRVAFRKLAVLYMRIDTAAESAWKELLCSVGELFPAQTDAIRLKRSLVSVPADLSPTERLERAWGIVSFLLDSPYSAAYPSLNFDFNSSAGSFWKEKKEETIALLIRLVHREEMVAAASLADGIASAVDAGSLRAIAEVHAELVPLIIRHNPALAFEIDTWKLSEYIQIQVFETLTKLSLTQMDWGRIVAAMLIASTNVSVRDAVERAGPFAMSCAFQWLEHQVAQDILPSLVWRDALASSAIGMLTQNKNLLPAQLSLTAWCAPTDDVRRTLSALRWDVQRLGDEPPETIPFPLRIFTAFLLLTIGLRDDTDIAVKLILRNFFTVHAALASGEHSSESWCLLSPELPTFRWHDWDRCKKLRCAVSAYLTLRGESFRLLDIAKTPNEKKIARKVMDIDRDDWLTEFID
jgi:hypothetical protein